MTKMFTNVFIQQLSNMAPGATVTNGSVHMNGNVNGKVYHKNGHKTNGTHHKVIHDVFC